jgi:hypothetical protein
MATKTAQLDTSFKTMMPNGLFARAVSLGPAIWFYLWCVARTTKEVVYDNDETRYGCILGGMPVRTSDIAADIPDITEWTLNEWRKKCVEAQLIRTKRTPAGYVIQVIGSVKFLKTPPERRQRWEKLDEGDVGKTQDHTGSDVGKSQSHIN